MTRSPLSRVLSPCSRKLIFKYRGSATAIASATYISETLLRDIFSQTRPDHCFRCNGELYTLTDLLALAPFYLQHWPTAAIVVEATHYLLLLSWCMVKLGRVTHIQIQTIFAPRLPKPSGQGQLCLSPSGCLYPCARSAAVTQLYCTADIYYTTTPYARPARRETNSRPCRSAQSWNYWSLTNLAPGGRLDIAISPQLACGH
ncbi:hypothetical protein J6590_068326 [Homalodisca vitripennis]|nr:hypothetical protein J6590_068326 [Homalodisca vitripennis]